MLRKLVLGAAALALAAGPAAAQDGTAGSFRVGPRVGYTMYHDGTGLKPAVGFGLDAVYFATKNVGIGVLLDYSRPETDSSYFPVEMTFGGSSSSLDQDGETFIFGVQQPVTVAQYQLLAEFRFGDRFQPFINGSAGGYTMYLDPQVANGNTHFTNWAFSAGVGFNFRAGASTGVRLEARDFVFTGYDRANLDVSKLEYDWTVSSGSRNEPTRFPDVLPAQPAFSGTAHNFQVALGFTFTPGGR
jgi:hypothetical protein